jgi:spermidine synthase
MKPTEVLARERTPDGEELALTARDGVYSLRLAGEVLMSSRAHGSERALAELACSRLPRSSASSGPRVLIGGLGFGYTLRAALDALPSVSAVAVWEFSSLVLAAMRGEVGALSGRPLDDPRVRIHHGDVREALGKQPFDAILLDVDNGPNAFTLKRNQRLYSTSGLALLHRSLTPKGILAVWAEAPDPNFERRLHHLFTAKVETARSLKPGRGTRHTIYLATSRATSRAPNRSG